MKILLKNALIVLPDHKEPFKGDLIIEDDIISKIGSDLKDNCNEVFDCQGKYLLPGLIDMHVHSRDPGYTYKEDLQTLSDAALAGGFTTLAVMPNTNPVSDNVDTLNYIYKKASDIGGVDIKVIAAITKDLKGKELNDLKALKDAGAVAFSDDGCCTMDSALMLEALKFSKENNILIIEHTEDHTLSTAAGIDIRAAEKLNLKGVYDAAEDIMVYRDIRLCEITQGYMHITHMSNIRSFELVEYAKKLSLNVSCDVTPHHLLLDYSLIDNPKKTVFKVNPPLRSKKDIEVLNDGLLRGVIDAVITDHAPHSIEEKSRDFAQAPCGMSGIETAAAVLIDNYVRTNKMSMSEFCNLYSLNPAKLLRLNDRGAIKEGLRADLTLIDTDSDYEIGAEGYKSKGKNNPFTGKKSSTKVIATFVKGKKVY